MKRITMLACLSLLTLGLSSFTEKENKTESVTTEAVASTPTLVQTCGNRLSSDVIYIDQSGSYLYFTTGANSSFRIDWQWNQGGGAKYYSSGTTQVQILGDRFTISVPGESGPNIKTYCFVIER